jgi:hypothetical protein
MQSKAANRDQQRSIEIHGQRTSAMMKFVLLATIASLSIVNASVAHAQAAISEPGAYAFYHPNGDVLRAGPSQFGPRAEPYSATNPANAMASAPSFVRPARRHRR